MPEVRKGVRCPTGEARLTPAFDLPARHVIHTVGPRFRGGTDGEPELLAACHRNCIALALEQGCSTLAFPAISCGVFGYPVRRAARVAVQAVRDNLESRPQATISVSFVLFEDDTFDAFQSAIEQWA